MNNYPNLGTKRVFLVISRFAFHNIGNKKQSNSHIQDLSSLSKSQNCMNLILLKVMMIITLMMARKPYFLF